MDISTWLQGAAGQLKNAGIDSARLDAELLLAATIHEPRTYLHAHSDEKLSPNQIASAKTKLSSRLDRVPIAYILGEKEFYGRSFIVSPQALIPRPESEELVNLIKKYIKSNSTILDVGTGSGCIGLTLKLELPNTKITVSDISNEAIALARKNAQNLGVTSVDYILTDLLDHWLHNEKSDQFDCIVANLPYVDRSWQVSPETTSEPDLALFADDNGLSLIKKIIVQAPKILSNAGLLVLELDTRQIPEIISFAEENDFEIIAQKPFALVLKLNRL